MTEIQDIPGDDQNTHRPEWNITIKGERITVREFTFLEGMSAGARAEAMIQSLGESIERTQKGKFTYSDIERVFSQHIDVLVSLIATSTGKPEIWVRGLSDCDGQRLVMAFWVTNSQFFTKRIVANVQIQTSRAIKSGSRDFMLN